MSRSSTSPEEDGPEVDGPDPVVGFVQADVMLLQGIGGEEQHRLVRLRELGEVLLERQRVAGHPHLFEPRAVGPVGRDEAEGLVLIDAGVPHGSTLRGCQCTISADH
jgi:hypothetical protein